MIRAIVAVDEKWGIGKKNDLLFRLREDMKFFRETTLGATVCMGYNTLLSFPNGKPLPKRNNVVICPADVTRDDVVCVHSMEEMLSLIRAAAGDVYVIGGATFYRSMLPYCEEVLVTKVAADGGAELFFDNLDENPNFICSRMSLPINDSGYKIVFTVYRNINPIKP